MSTYAYNEILNRFQSLPPSEQRELLEALEAIMQQQNMQRPRRSVLEFEGIGQETWKGIDVQEFINQERASWNG